MTTSGHIEHQKPKCLRASAPRGRLITNITASVLRMTGQRRLTTARHAGHEATVAMARLVRYQCRAFYASGAEKMRLRLISSAKAVSMPTAVEACSGVALQYHHRRYSRTLLHDAGLFAYRRRREGIGDGRHTHPAPSCNGRE